MRPTTLISNGLRLMLEDPRNPILSPQSDVWIPGRGEGGPWMTWRHMATKEHVSPVSS